MAMREKYIEERFPRWFEFGESRDGLVDLADSDGDVIHSVNKETARLLLLARNAYVDAMVEIFKGDPAALYNLIEPGRR